MQCQCYQPRGVTWKAIIECDVGHSFVALFLLSGFTFEVKLSRLLRSLVLLELPLSKTGNNIHQISNSAFVKYVANVFHASVSSVSPENYVHYLQYNSFHFANIHWNQWLIRSSCRNIPNRTKPASQLVTWLFCISCGRHTEIRYARGCHGYFLYENFLDRPKIEPVNPSMVILDTHAFTAPLAPFLAPSNIIHEICLMGGIIRTSKVHSISFYSLHWIYNKNLPNLPNHSIRQFFSNYHDVNISSKFKLISWRRSVMLQTKATIDLSLDR